MQDAVEALNFMQTAFQLLGERSPVELPELVVIGNQSSGKSSVLESIIKREFLPRGTQMVTRCPIILQLVPLKPDTKRPNGVDEETTEWAVLHVKKESPVVFTNFTQLGSELKRCSEKIATTGAVISDVPIGVDIYADNVLPLRLVDLPGMIAFSKDKPELTNLTETMCKKYISKHIVIIVAVSAANDDYNNSKALGLAREVDPQGKRTIAVFTKLDLAKTSTGYTVESLETQTGIASKSVICVINRSQEELDNEKSFEDAVDKERQFLIQNHPDIADHHGTLFLEKTLSEVLRSHMVSKFPGLITELRFLIDRNKEAFSKLASPPLAKDRSRLLAQYIQDYVDAYKSSIKGAVDCGRLIAGAEIRRLLQEQLPAELDKIPAIDPTLTDERIKIIIENSGGPDVSLWFNVDVLRQLIRHRVMAFEKPATEIAKSVFTKMDNETFACFEIHENLDEKLVHFPFLRQRLVAETKCLLQSRRDKIKRKIKNLFQEEYECVNFGHSDFLPEATRLIQETEKANPGQDPKATAIKTATDSLFNREVVLQKKLLELYFAIVRKTLKHSLVKTMYSALISFMQKTISHTLNEKLLTLSQEESEALWKQSEDITNRREHIEKTLEVLEKTENALDHLLG